MNIDCCKSYVGKQIIGLTPSAPAGPLCLYYTNAFNDSSYGAFSDPSWDFGGFGTDFTAYSNSIGGYVVQDGFYTVASYDNSNSLRFYYLGTSAPADFVIYNPNISANVTISYSNIACQYGCIGLPSFRYNNSPYDWVSIGNIIPYANVFLNWGGQLDFNAGAQGVEDILNNMLSKYQPQARAFVVDDGGAFFTITFQDFYYDNTAVILNGFSLTYNFNLSEEFHTAAPC